MRIEVVYALPDQQYSRWVELADGASAAQALAASGFIDAFPGVTAASPVGIYGEQISPDDTLSEGDRLEIYRPLLLDPMQARRKRADRQRK